jgi:hypothetical protein
LPNRKQEEGWSSEKETRRRLECLIGNKEKDEVPKRKQVVVWNA